MKITITVENPITNYMMDIQIDQRQRIKTTLKVLGENKAEFSPYINSPIVRVKSSGRRVSTEQTYEESGIYNGAEILLEDLQTGRG